MKKILIIKHVPIEGPGTLGSYLKDRGVEILTVDAWQDAGAGLNRLDLSSLGGVAVMGGPMNVYEDSKYPFLTIEKYLIRELIMRKIPVFGVCLGAQLIAVSLGARIRKSPTREIGWFDVELTSAAQTDPLMRQIPSVFRVFQWHEDMFELPAGATLLAENNGITQAFCFRGLAWGFQFHIEIDQGLISEWVREHERAGGHPLDAEGFLRDYQECAALYNAQAINIFDGFLRQTQKSAPASQAQPLAA